MRTPRVRSARLHEHAAAKPTWLGPATRPQASGLGSLFGLSLPVCSRRLRSNRVGRARARSCLVLSWLPARNSAPRSLARTDQQIARGSERATGRGREVGMGSEGRVWNGAGVAAGSGYGGSVEAKATTAAPADVPTSAASVDISLPLPEMSPHIMQVPPPTLLSLFDPLASARTSGWSRAAVRLSAARVMFEHSRARGASYPCPRTSR
jgi:hypothetical protein